MNAIRNVAVSARHARPSATPVPPAIEVETADRSWVVAAPTQAEHEMWLRALRRAADLE